MGKKIGRLLLTLFGLLLGLSVVWLLSKNRESVGMTALFESLPPWSLTLVYVLCAVLFGLIFFFLAPALINGVAKLIKRIERKSRELTMQQIFVGVIGLLLGLIIAFFISLLIQKIPFTSVVIPLDIIVFIMLGYLGFKIPVSRIKEINLPNWFRKGENAQQPDTKARPKILDTSAIIDGRFFDVYKTGIIEGTVVIPQFVLDELRHIADSADPLKRARGRRGLDAINALRESGAKNVTVSSVDYEELTEVDTKLIKLALDMGGVVVTNDYNLNKVAAVQSVPVFNINDLSNSLRISVVAGEVVGLTIVKEGKEHGQGIAYFDDGTMVVVDGASKLVGENVTAVVTSVLQTSAGRMVFAKVEEQ